MAAGKIRRYRPQRSKRMPLSKAQVKAVRSVAKKAMDGQAEKKFLDTVLTNNVTSFDVPTVTQIALPAQGDGQGQRDGDQVKLKSLHIKGLLRHNGSTDTRGRIIVVQVMEDLGAAPTLSQILEDVTTQDIFNSPYKINSDLNYKILWDYRNCLSDDSHPVRMFDKVFRLNQQHHFSGSTVDKGTIYVLNFDAAETNASGTGTRTSWYARLKYVDY